MNFGIPNQRKKRRVEKFPNTPVVTIEVDGGKGTSRKMRFNTKAVEALGLGKTASVAFSFEDDNVYVGNAQQPGIPEEYGIKVTKSSPRTISDKRTYQYISNLLGLDNTVENDFEIIPQVKDGVDVFRFQTISTETVEQGKAEPEPETTEQNQEQPDFSQATLNN